MPSFGAMALTHATTVGTLLFALSFHCIWLSMHAQGHQVSASRLLSSPNVAQPAKPKLPDPFTALSQPLKGPSFVNKNYVQPLADLPKSRAQKRPAPVPDAVVASAEATAGRER